MLEKLSPEAKVVVMATFMISVLFIGPVITLIVFVLAAGVIIAPWPAVVVICTYLVLITAWLVLWGRLDSSFLMGMDFAIVVGLFLLLLGTTSSNDIRVWHYAVTLYALALGTTILHTTLALFVALGINPRPHALPKPATA